MTRFLTFLKPSLVANPTLRFFTVSSQPPITFFIVSEPPITLYTFGCGSVKHVMMQDLQDLCSTEPLNASLYIDHKYTWLAISKLQIETLLYGNPIELSASDTRTLYSGTLQCFKIERQYRIERLKTLIINGKV